MNRVCNGYDIIGLHDCVISEMQIQDDDLILKFDNGFWLLEDAEQNIYHETVRTGRSELRIKGYEDITLYRFKPLRLFRWTLSTTRINISLETLIQRINNGEWQAEITDEWYGEYGCLLGGVMGKREEFMMNLYCKGFEYSWDELRGDRKW